MEETVNITGTVTGEVENISTLHGFRGSLRAPEFIVRLEDGSTIRVINEGKLRSTFTGVIVADQGEGAITGLPRYSVNLEQTHAANR